MKTEWVLCPRCTAKTRIVVREDTKISSLPLYCPKCKAETLINVDNMTVTIA